MRETVGLTRSPVFESKDWESESKDKYRIRPLTFADRLLERNEEKEKAYQQAFDKWVADKARRKLQYFVNHRFGGAVDNLFQFADTDGDGLISVSSTRKASDSYRGHNSLPHQICICIDE